PAIRTSTRVTDRVAVRGLTRLPWISGAFCRKFAGSPVCPQVPDERAGDETAMGFRRLLPEIRWQPRLSPGAPTNARAPRLPWISGAFCRKFAGSPVCPQVPDERAGDETAMGFRRLLPEIRWQPRLSPGPHERAGDETAMDFRRLLPEIRWQPRLSPDPRRTRGRRDCPRVSRISLLPPPPVRDWRIRGQSHPGGSPLQKLRQFSGRQGHRFRRARRRSLRPARPQWRR